MVDKLLKAFLVLVVIVTTVCITMAATTPDSVRGPVGVCVDTTGGLTGVETPVITNGVVSCKDGSFVSAVPMEVH